MRNKSGNDPTFSRDLLYYVNTLIHTQESECLPPSFYCEQYPALGKDALGLGYVSSEQIELVVMFILVGNQTFWLIYILLIYIRIPILPFNQTNNKQTSLKLRSHGYIQLVLQPLLSLQLTDLNGKKLGWSDLNFHGTLYDCGLNPKMYSDLSFTSDFFFFTLHCIFSVPLSICPDLTI